MHSAHLTRGVFRAIIANRPYVVRHCQRRPSKRPQTIPTTLDLRQRRHLFGLNWGSARQGFQGLKATPANVERALGQLVDLARARRNQSRLPQDQEVVDAFRFLFASRVESPRRLTRNEVFLATEAFKHLKERDHVLTGNQKTSLSEEDLENVLLSLASSTSRDRFRTDARILATLTFDALKLRSAKTEEQDSLAEGSRHQTHGSALVTYITVLSKTGSAEDGLALLRSSPRSSDPDSLPIWSAVLRGLASEGRMPQFWDVIQDVQDNIGPLDPISQETLTSYFADHDEVGALKKVFALPLADHLQPTTTTLVKVIDCAIQNDDAKWVEKAVELLGQRRDSGSVAGTLLLYHATQKPDIRDIRNTIDQLVRSGVPDVLSMETFNRLIENSYSKNNPQQALQFIDLAESSGLRPDGKTRSLQLDYDLRQGNRAAAGETYELLSREDFPTDRSDVPVLNRYIATLAFSNEHDYTHLLQIVDYLLESGAELEAEAIAGLCHVFLQRDELEEATGLLRHRVDSYPGDDRARIAAVFRQFILDSAVKDQRAFNAYELFRHAFPETPVEDRIPLMESFFDRNRPDLACLVFGHMRQRDGLGLRPTAEAYAKCFEGIAKCKDIDGLQMIYSVLKLDIGVDPTTRIHNGLMAAYTECRQPFVGIIDHFWKIMESREGPTLSSFILALRACEKWIPQGGNEARHVMALMQRFNLVITKEVYEAYIGALAGQSEFENVVELIEEMEHDIGEAPDAITIGTFYNAIPWQYRKDEVEKWAKQAYPELWADLESFGDVIDEEFEIRYFKIDRSVDMDDELLFDKGDYHPVIAQASQTMLETPTT